MNPTLRSLHHRVAIASVPLLAMTLSASPARAASLQQVKSFGNNPSNIAMYIYVPDKPAAKPPVVVALHYCSGSASAYYSGLASGLVSAANQYGYIVIFPQTTAYGSCWDVFSAASLKHNGGSDSAGIVSMVSYTVSHYSADANRVYAVGSSSGAMMTNVLLGAYPDVFKAGAAFSGVPFGCWVGADANSGWNSACANGQVTKTAQQWGALVQAAYPGFAGTRPRMQLWQGDADQTISFNNFGESIKEWTNVLGVAQAPTTTEQNTPQAKFTRTRYKDDCGNVRVEAVQEGGQPHLINVNATEVVHFFGLDTNAPDPGAPGCASSGSGGTTSSSSSTGSGVSTSSGGATTSGSSSTGSGATTGSGAATTSGAGGASSGAGATSTSNGATAGSGPAAAGAGGSGGGDSTTASGGVGGSGGAPGEPGGAESSAGCGCVVGSGGERGGVLATLMLIGAVLYRRRRARA